MPITSLSELCDVLNDIYTDMDAEPNSPEWEAEIARRAEDAGLPVVGSLVDWANLPTFGGEEPSNTAGVWSWDAESLLVGEGYEVKIIPRQDRN